MKKILFAVFLLGSFFSAGSVSACMWYDGCYDECFVSCDIGGSCAPSCTTVCVPGCISDPLPECSVTVNGCSPGNYGIINPSFDNNRYYWNCSNGDGLSVDCSISRPAWSAWSACSVSCGGGTQTGTCQGFPGSCDPVSDSGCTCSGSNSRSCNTQACSPPSPPIPSGSISASSCTIPVGGSQCTSTITWNANVPNNVVLSTGEVFSTHEAGSFSESASWISHSPTTFILKNHATGDELERTSISGQCISGSEWNGSKCVRTPVCGSTDIHEPPTISPPNSGLCSVGTATPVTQSAPVNTSNPARWLWKCENEGVSSPQCSSRRSCSPSVTLSSCSKTCGGGKQTRTAIKSDCMQSSQQLDCNTQACQPGGFSEVAP